MRRFFLIAVPYAWLLALFLIPFIIVFKISLSDLALSIPPYSPTAKDGIWAMFTAFDLENFTFLASDDLYWKAYLSSLKIALISTVLAVLVGYPMAYGMARAPEEWRPTLMMLVILPFWTSFLIRVYAWVGILSNEGLLNQFLLWLGIIDTPLTIMNTTTAVYIGIVYTYLPFMILPIYAALDRLDESLIEAAEDLGCSRLKAFWLVTIPLSRNGIIAGCFLVFIPALGEFVIPSLLGGSGTLMIGKVLFEEFFNNRDWPVASAVAVILLLIDGGAGNDTLIGGDGADTLVFACTGEFPPMDGDTGVIFPSRILNALAESLLPRGRLGLLIPLPEQSNKLAAKWQRTGVEVVAEALRPSADDTHTRAAAERLAHLKPDLVAMDCMSYTPESKAIVSAIVGVPTLLAITVTGRAIRGLLE